MIYTLTCNPALDYVMEFPTFTAGRTNRAGREELQVGGKGINVSLVLRQLGAESVALGFVAGDTGELLRRRLEELGVRTDLIGLPEGMTRINVKVKCGEETELNGRGPEVPEKAAEELLEKLSGLREGDTLVLAGSLPAGVGGDFYQRILARLQGRGVEVAADAEGEVLKGVLPFRPFLIKPNHHELEGLAGERIEAGDLPRLTAAARELQRQGARNVLVSLGGEGALLVGENGRVYRQRPAAGRLVNSVGAGDSMVAGFLVGYRRGGPVEGLLLGTAAGGATAFSRGLATKEEISAVYGQLKKG